MRVPLRCCSGYWPWLSPSFGHLRPGVAGIVRCLGAADTASESTRAIRTGRLCRAWSSGATGGQCTENLVLLALIAGATQSLMAVLFCRSSISFTRRCCRGVRAAVYRRGGIDVVASKSWSHTRSASSCPAPPPGACCIRRTCQSELDGLLYCGLLTGASLDRRAVAATLGGDSPAARPHGARSGAKNR